MTVNGVFLLCVMTNINKVKDPYISIKFLVSTVLMCFARDCLIERGEKLQRVVCLFHI